MKSYSFKDKFNISPIAYRNLSVYERNSWGSNNFEAHRAKASERLRFRVILPSNSRITPAQALRMIVKDKTFGNIFVRPHRDHKNADYLLLKWQPTDILLVEALAKGLEKAGQVWGLEVQVENL